ncbi:MAG: cheD [Rhodospirillales bacterium]|jgi:chemotaxis protein CheD|nr:cheD [Rhodospirillales bacterium]
MRVARRAALAAADPPRRRYYDPVFHAMAVKVLPGDLYVTDAVDEMLVTILGSCVAACIRDPNSGIGGMNHFMLPSSIDGKWGKAPSLLRYGNFAMDRLIDDIVARGGHRDDLEVKVFGGAVGATATGSRVGDDNATFIEAYLARLKLPAMVQLLRCAEPLRVHYFPLTGRALVLKLQDIPIDEAVRTDPYDRKALAALSKGRVERLP